MFEEVAVELFAEFDGSLDEDNDDGGTVLDIRF